jgi:site-specific DNA-methyltransferase (adenine-specific)
VAEPYYQDESVTLYHGDCREVLSTLADESVAAVLTDPPYTERTHSKARSNATGGGVTEGIQTFAAITDDDLRELLSECGRVSRGWVVATMDYRHAVEFDTEPPAGLKSQRVGVWVKTNPTPQLTGDRPAQGWEAISYLHRSDRRSAWNGHGAHGNYVMRIASPEGHPTAKPLPLLSDLVRKFTQPGDLILDPWAGSGTTGRAAKDEGRRSLLIEAREDYCDLIARRLTQDTLFGGAA